MNPVTENAPVADPTRPPNRRRQLIVDKPFQFRLVGLLLSVWAANSLFFSLVLYLFYHRHLLRFYHLVPRLGATPLVPSSTILTVTFGFIFAFGLVVVGILGVYLSQQIAGPLYRVKLSLNRVSQGDLDFEVRFRDRDFLEDLPGYFNKMLRALKAQGLSDVEALRDIEARLDEPTVARAKVRALREAKESSLRLAEAPSGKDSEAALQRAC